MNSAATRSGAPSSLPAEAILPGEDAFRDPKTGEVNRYALRAQVRLAAFSFYLWRWRMVGHERAAEMTCAVFGHDRAGARCDRCGTPLLRA